MSGDGHVISPILPRQNNIAGRQNLPQWKHEDWDLLDRNVLMEIQRTRVAAKFLPLYGPLAPNTKTVPSDTIQISATNLSVDEGAQTTIIEAITEFEMTEQQVHDEEQTSPRCTLAVRAANLLSQLEDLFLFQGGEALKNTSFFGDPSVSPPILPKFPVKQKNATPDLVGLLHPDPPNHIDVPNKGVDKTSGLVIFGENTFGAVAHAYAILQGLGHYGPYVLVLHTDQYADSFAPLQDTLIAPCDRFKGFVGDRYYGTGTLPPFTGVFLSIGGNSMDRSVAMEAATTFTQVDPDRLYRFQVFTRFALRLKDNTAVVKLAFTPA
jgi:uncharacterized linocin/CFP29 family protein